jgi:hypothetical protein
MKSGSHAEAGRVHAGECEFSCPGILFLFFEKNATK